MNLKEWKYIDDSKAIETPCKHFAPNGYFVDDPQYPVSKYPVKIGSGACQKYCKKFMSVDYDAQEITCKD